MYIALCGLYSIDYTESILMLLCSSDISSEEQTRQIQVFYSLGIPLFWEGGS